MDDFERVERDRRKGEAKAEEVKKKARAERTMLIKVVGRYKVSDMDGNVKTSADEPFRMPMSIAKRLMDGNKVERGDPIPDDD